MKSLLILIICLTPYLSTAQKNSYSIYSVKNELMGKLNVNRTKTDSTMLIEVESEIKVKMLITIAISYTLSSIYSDGKLHSNTVITYRNKKIQSLAQTVKQKNQYKFTKDGTQVNYVKAIAFVESMLYYNEPKAVSFIYSEFDGVHKSIKKFKIGHYKITNPLNGNVSEYLYKNGQLESAKIHHPLLTLFILKDKAPNKN